MADVGNDSSVDLPHWCNFIVKIRYMKEPDFSHYLWMFLYVRPVFVICGIIGNTLTLLVLFRKNLRSKSFTIYLRALAVCDTGALVARLLMWINLVRDQLYLPLMITINSSFQCATVEYIFTFVQVCSGWLVVAVAWERAVVITFPLKSRIIAGPKIASGCTFGIILFTAVVCTYILAAVHYLEEKGCYMSSEWRLIHYHVALSFMTGVPFVFIAAANIWIVVRLRRAKTAILSTERMGPSLAERKANRMLLIVTFCFFVLLFPNAVSRLLAFDQDVEVPLTVKELAKVIVDINYAFNFYLYVLSGEQIRVEVKNMLKCT